MPGRFLAICLFIESIAGFGRQTGDPSQTKCVLEGNAVDFATGEPIPRAKIRLTHFSGTAAGQIATTDDAGHFRLENIVDGDYELTGERTGYLKSEFGARQPGARGTPLRLKAGDTLTGLVVKLARCALVTGKVTDENGEPMTRVLIYAVSREWFRGQPVYARSEGIWTDDRGEYQVAD